MTVNTTTILDPARPAGYQLEAALAGRARAMCRTVAELAEFVEACVADLLARFATPEGRDADALYSDAARDLLHTLEGWEDDLDGVYREHIVPARRRRDRGA
jgi:hypothetical protein